MNDVTGVCLSVCLSVYLPLNKFVIDIDEI
jgi:hypothetical protein